VSEPRLVTEIEVSAWLARAAAAGGFGTVLRRGDAQRGALLLLILERGRPHSLVERLLQPDGRYRWEARRLADSDSGDQHLARAGASDPDMWILELDVSSGERFVVETIASA
jgi:hypothetical protein